MMKEQIDKEMRSLNKKKDEAEDEKVLKIKVGKILENEPKQIELMMSLKKHIW